MTISPPTDQITIRRAINGDESALRAIWKAHAPRVDALVLRLVGDADQAADVAQEVWIQIFSGASDVSGRFTVLDLGAPDCREPHVECAAIVAADVQDGSGD